MSSTSCLWPLSLVVEDEWALESTQASVLERSTSSVQHPLEKTASYDFSFKQIEAL